MREGTDLIRALAEASPMCHGQGDGFKVAFMDRVYATSIFGALEKFSQPIANLLAAAKKAGTMSAGEFDTMLVPSGMQELLHWTKAENVYYYLNGRTIDSKEKIKFGLDGGRVDPSSGLKVFTTYPSVDYSQGTAYSSMKKSPIMNERVVGVAYFLGDSYKGFIVNYKTGTMQLIDATYIAGVKPTATASATNVAEWAWDSGIKTDLDAAWKALTPEQKPVFVRRVTCLMSSAILAKSGSETGEMCVILRCFSFPPPALTPVPIPGSWRTRTRRSPTTTRRPRCSSCSSGCTPTYSAAFPTPKHTSSNPLTTSHQVPRCRRLPAAERHDPARRPL